MNFVEYWLLDNTFERPSPFFHLDSEFDEYAVRRLWKFDRERLLDGLEAIFHRQEIVVHDGRVIIENPQRCLLNEFLDSECKAYYDDGWIPPTYRLTESGGRVWEELTIPNWDHYVSEKWVNIDNDVGGGTTILQAASRERIEEYLRNKSTHHPYTVIEGTEVWESLKPMQITYWKELPIGMRLTCETFYDYGKPSTGDGYRIWWESLWEWYTPPALADVAD